MSGNAKPGFGVKIEIETVTPGVYDLVGELNSLGDVSLSKDTIDTTTHDNTSGFRDFIPGPLTDTDEITGEANFLNDADSTSVRTLLVAGTKRNIKITFPTSPATVFTAAGYFTKFAISGGEMTEKMTYSFSFKPTGAPTWS